VRQIDFCPVRLWSLKIRCLFNLYVPRHRIPAKCDLNSTDVIEHGYEMEQNLAIIRHSHNTIATELNLS